MPVLFDRSAQRLVRILKTPFSIGRDVGSDLVLNQPSVSRNHAVVLDGSGGSVIRNLSRINPVQVNGALVVRERILSDGDQLRFGEALFEYRLGEIEAQDAHRARTLSFTVRSDREQVGGVVLLQGHVMEDAGAAGVLNLCSMAQISGVITLIGSSQALLWMQRGMIVRIQAGTCQDAEAIALLGNWDFASFEVRKAEPIARTLPTTWSMTRILLEIGRLYDARRRSRAAGGSPSDR